MKKSQIKINTAYKKLENRFAEISDIERIIELLGWDRSVKMPANGAIARAEQNSTLVKIKHQRLTASDMPDLLSKAEENTDILSSWEQSNLKEMRRYYTKSACLPDDLLQALTYTAIKCETTWRTARIENDFSSVLPLFEELINLTQQKANIISPNKKPYDAMLNQYNEGACYADIQPIFEKLENWLPNFLNSVLNAQKNIIPLNCSFPIEKQKQLSKWLADKMGYSGRIDTSDHPFSIGRIGDVRITNRYNEEEFILYAVLCTMHEAGHGLYDMQLPEKWRRQPVGGSMDISMAIHESQSMIWEMQIGHTKEFWEFITPKCQEMFSIDKGNLAWKADNLCAISNHVKRGYIRVDADEVTYPLHILMRTKLEKALIEGSLKAKELPYAWNDEMQRLLGIIPPTDKLGCLQDPHWYGGNFGYFPAYLLGAMTAAQIFQTMSNDIPQLNNHISNGDFTYSRKWLKDNVHEHGCKYTPKELVKIATGDYLQIDTYKQHLKNRYLND